MILRHLNGGKDDQLQLQDFTPDRRESGDLATFKSAKRESGFNQQPMSMSMSMSMAAPVENSTLMYQTQSGSENYEIKQLIENIRLSNDLEGGIKQLHTALKKYPGIVIF